MNSSKLNQNLMLFATVIIPELEGDSVRKRDFWNNYYTLFLEMDIDIQKQLEMLIKLISVLSFFYTFHAFNQLDFKQRQKYIKRLFNFPYSKIVSGLTGLRSLCLFAYYSQEDNWKEINYNGPV
jgi:hypothetical protein